MFIQFVPDLYVKRWCLAYTFFINIFVYQNFENYLSDIPTFVINDPFTAFLGLQDDIARMSSAQE